MSTDNKNGIKNKFINEDVIIESLMCFKRAGASAIVSYFALDIAKRFSLIKIIFKNYTRLWK